MHINTLRYQTAGSAEIDLLLELMEAYYTYDGLSFHAGEARIALQQLVGDDTLGRAWLIVKDGIPVGYMVLTFWYSLEFHGRAAFVDELFIREEHRGRGVGREALRFAGEFCSERGIKALRLEVENTNTKARHLYEREGFKKHERSLMTKWI